MTFYKAIISYIGSDYFGWQVQPNARTIQGEVNKSLAIINQCQLSEIKTMGSGRTDAGVHAINQVVKIEMPLNIPCDGLKKALNSHLPKEIRVEEVEPSHEDFHPVRDAKVKEYKYFFTVGEDLRGPHLVQTVSHFRGNIDVKLMKKGAKHFVGKHDFQNFRTVGTDVASTVREIYSLEITSQAIEFQRVAPLEVYCLTVKGEGFLKQMVRLIVGTLINYAQCKITDEQITEHLSAKKEDKLGPVAPAEGLFLYNVTY
ncbi:tRNA pseudouridine(38-40) synthase TruA [Bacteriovoracaceae bacterium]|nr:tRNA pseudouridine(38-40) synthase TruA [Bacteriovoracaceae bacterium]